MWRASREARRIMLLALVNPSELCFKSTLYKHGETSNKGYLNQNPALIIMDFPIIVSSDIHIQGYAC